MLGLKRLRAELVSAFGVFLVEHRHLRAQQWVRAYVVYKLGRDSRLVDEIMLDIVHEAQRIAVGWRRPEGDPGVPGYVCKYDDPGV